MCDIKIGMSYNQTLPYNSAVRVTLVVNKANCQRELLLLSSNWLRNNCGRKCVLTGFVYIYNIYLRNKRLQLVLSTLGVLVALSWFITSSLKICICLNANLCSIASWIWGESLFLQERVCSIWSFPSGCGERNGSLVFSLFVLMLLSADGLLFELHKTWQMSECLWAERVWCVWEGGCCHKCSYSWKQGLPPYWRCAGGC